MASVIAGLAGLAGVYLGFRLSSQWQADREREAETRQTQAAIVTVKARVLNDVTIATSTVRHLREPTGGIASFMLPDERPVRPDAAWLLKPAVLLGIDQYEKVLLQQRPCYEVAAQSLALCHRRAFYASCLESVIDVGGGLVRLLDETYPEVKMPPPLQLGTPRRVGTISEECMAEEKRLRK